MDIITVNEAMREICLKESHKSFESLLVVMECLLDKTAYVYYEMFRDKILYSKEDIKQEIAIELWIHLSNNVETFENERDAVNLIIMLADKVLEKTGS